MTAIRHRGKWKQTADNDGTTDELTQSNALLVARELVSMAGDIYTSWSRTEVSVYSDMTINDSAADG